MEKLNRQGETREPRRVKSRRHDTEIPDVLSAAGLGGTQGGFSDR